MEKILIATKNKDKYEIVKRILTAVNPTNYKFYSLYDIKNFKDDDKEVGDIEKRAYDKANNIFSSIDKNDFKYIIGIDDGIKMKGSLKENVKDYIEDIINDRYLVEGEEVEIVRAYSFLDENGKSTTITTEIPFKYHKIDSSFKIEENSYPLSHVLKPVNIDKTVAQMSNDESNNYYMKYSEEEIKKIFI